MLKLLFFSRVAFICNVCFLLTFILQYSTWLPSQALSSTIIILGNVFALFLNLVVNILYGIMMINHRSLHDIPRWLMIANFIFFIIQIILLLQ